MRLRSVLLGESFPHGLHQYVGMIIPGSKHQGLAGLVGWTFLHNSLRNSAIERLRVDLLVELPDLELNLVW